VINKLFKIVLATFISVKQLPSWLYHISYTETVTGKAERKGDWLQVTGLQQGEKVSKYPQQKSAIANRSHLPCAHTSDMRNK